MAECSWCGRRGLDPWANLGGRRQGLCSERCARESRAMRRGGKGCLGCSGSSFLIIAGIVIFFLFFLASL